MSSMKKQRKNSNKTYWRSINQLADTPEFREFLQSEFPEGASELQDHISRRKFITLMGASMALAGLTACRKPVEKIVPYAKAPEEVIPGIPKYYATTMTMGTHGIYQRKKSNGIRTGRFCLKNNSGRNPPVKQPSTGL